MSAPIHRHRIRKNIFDLIWHGETDTITYYDKVSVHDIIILDEDKTDSEIRGIIVGKTQHMDGVKEGYCIIKIIVLSKLNNINNK